MANRTREAALLSHSGEGYRRKWGEGIQNEIASGRYPNARHLTETIPSNFD